jgi:hypothetical protein
MKTQDLLLAAAAAATAFFLMRKWQADKARKEAAAARYNVNASSDQAAQLAAQDRGFYD